MSVVPLRSWYSYNYTGAAAARFIAVAPAPDRGPASVRQPCARTGTAGNAVERLAGLGGRL